MTFSKRLALNSRARRKEVGRLLGVARRQAHLSQRVVADVLNYDQADISRIENGVRLLDVVDLENLAVLYEKSLDFFATWQTQLGLSNDELRARTLESKMKRGLRRIQLSR